MDTSELRTPATGRDRTRRSRLRARLRHRQQLTSQPSLLLLFTLLAAVNTLLCAAGWLPDSAATVVIMLGGFLLRVRALLLLYLVVASGLLFIAANRVAPLTPGQVVVIVATAVLVLLYARSREKLGVQGTLGESMLVDLRDRLRSQGRVPELPSQWQVDRTLRSAYGDSFSGDFLVASRSQNDQLEMVLVDVSGKGQAAGVRALHLSGAFGGLLGAMPQGQFMTAANTYLLRQSWHEGFATAVHLAVNLTTGHYSLSSAGHPPSAHYHAGSGRWDVIRGPGGPALGIIDDAEFPAHSGRIERGDALLLYTDGLVETPGRDLELGIDRLMGQAERMVSDGPFRGGADRIVDGTRTGETDDRALVLIWRE